MAAPPPFLYVWSQFLFFFQWFSREFGCLDVIPPRSSLRNEVIPLDPKRFHDVKSTLLAIRDFPRFGIRIGFGCRGCIGNGDLLYELSMKCKIDQMGLGKMCEFAGSAFFPDIKVQVVLRAGLICFSRFEAWITAESHSQTSYADARVLASICLKIT